ncbi:putative secreted protein [Candidatus Phytoplasma solani]
MRNIMMRNNKIKFKLLFIIIVLLPCVLSFNNFVFAITEIQKLENKNLSKELIQKMNPIMTTFLDDDIPMPSFFVNQFNTLGCVEFKQSNDINCYDYKFVHHYDFEGRLMTMQQYNPDGSLKYKFFYVYSDDKKKLQVIEIYLPEENKKPFFKFVNSHNDEGKLIKIQEFFLGFEGDIYIPVYSNKNLLFYIKKYSFQDEFKCLYKFIYNGDHQLEKIGKYNDILSTEETKTSYISYNKKQEFSEIADFNNYGFNLCTFVNTIK